MARSPRYHSCLSGPFGARAALLLALALVACDSRGLLATWDRVEGRSDESIGAGLTQSVTVRASVLLDGNDVEVRSILVNTGPASLTVSARLCGLDYGGTLALAEVPGILKCAAHSSTTMLAVGDSLIASDLMRIASPPGSYQLLVRHALQPDHWATVAILVR